MTVTSLGLAAVEEGCGVLKFMRTLRSVLFILFALSTACDSSTKWYFG